MKVKLLLFKMLNILCFSMYVMRFHNNGPAGPKDVGSVLTHWGRGHLNCLNARYRGF